jgi:hypothetical protein
MTKRSVPLPRNGDRDVSAAPLRRCVADGFDVVAVGVTDERAVVVGVVFGPQSRFVEHVSILGNRSSEEGVDGGATGRGEGQMCFAKTLPRRLPPNTEFEIWWRAVGNDVVEFEDPDTVQRRQDRVVEGGAGGNVSALNGYVVDHRPIMSYDVTRSRSEFVRDDPRTVTDKVTRTNS